MPDARTQYQAQRAQIVDKLKEIAPEPLATRLGAMIRPAITLETSPSSGELAPLVSKFGGAPDVPVGFEWPHFQGEPLSFVAQFNLEELVPFDLEERLPKSGLLSFWMNEEWASEGDFGAWRVFHFQGDQWKKLPVPHEPVDSFAPTPLQLDARASLPDVYSSAEFYNEEDKIQDRRLASALNDAFRWFGHRMFGFADNIQNDVRYECSPDWNQFLLSPFARELGLSSDDQTDWPDWELLLQISGDDHVRMEWGNTGAIYFLIRRVDLQARRFDRTWFVFQCC